MKGLIASCDYRIHGLELLDPVAMVQLEQRAFRFEQAAGVLGLVRRPLVASVLPRVQHSEGSIL